MSAVTLGLCGRIQGYSYLLDFVGLVPWLLVLNSITTMRGAAASGLAMATAFVVAIFAWFGFAIANYSAADAAAGLAVLTASASLLQPQFLTFAVVRHAATRHYGAALSALAAACAWVATEWIFPKLLADNLAHGIYPSRILRQFADLGGTAGITFLIVLINECFAMAIAGRRRGLQGIAPPLLAAVVILASMTGYGAARLSKLDSASDAEPSIGVGMIQSNIIGYDRLRSRMGDYEMVRFVLDTHFAMSREAIEKHQVDALLWSETMYPTTYGKPKSDVGAEFDREIQNFVSRSGVPLVFGSYDRDDAGEYNAAVVLAAGGGGSPRPYQVYRKSRLFFLTESVPKWLDSAALRSALPWAGTTQAGTGAKVLPLHLADGRQIPVLPMICLDDVDTSLAIEGARQGARMILAMSNDSWFTDHAAGAHLHLVVSAFRSIETRLPQMRVTTNGFSAAINPAGDVVAHSAMGERAIVVGRAQLSAQAPTLIVAWGDWVGAVALVFLGALLVGTRFTDSTRSAR